MGAINPTIVARKVSETIAKGELVEIGKIILDSGYTKRTSKSPSLVTNTKSYKKALELESRPLIAGIQKEISRIKDALATKDYTQEETRVLAGTLDILSRNFQLLKESVPTNTPLSLTEDQKANLRNLL